MSRQTIKKYSLGYSALHFFASLYHRIYYRRFILVNPENIPAKHPVIYALNHQNALMDALAIVFANNRQPVFMARADIFSKKSVARILYFLKILPAYRIRDGFHSVDQNKEVFKEVIQVLENNRPVGILPEGNHFGEKRLRPLRKGAGRIALLAEEANDFRLGLSIIPVGLDYSNYYNAGSDLLVIFGKPIRVSDYREQYIENQVQAINQLRDDLAIAMKEVMIDISSEEYYKAIYTAIELYGPIERKKQKLRNNLLNNFRVKKQISEKIITKQDKNKDELKELKKDTENYTHHLHNYGLKDRIVGKGKIKPVSLFLKSLLAILFIPFHLYGMVLNYLPYRLPFYLSRKIKDRHLLVSVRFGLGLVFFLAWYPILAISFFLIFHHPVAWLAFIISLPLLGVFSFYYYIHLLRLRGAFRWIRLKKKDLKAYEEISRLRKEIILLIEKIIS